MKSNSWISYDKRVPRKSFLNWKQYLCVVFTTAEFSLKYLKVGRIAYRDFTRYDLKNYHCKSCQIESCIFYSHLTKEWYVNLYTWLLWKHVYKSCTKTKKEKKKEGD